MDFVDQVSYKMDCHISPFALQTDTLKWIIKYLGYHKLIFGEGVSIYHVHFDKIRFAYKLQGGRGHSAVYFTRTQSFMITISYSLA